MAEGSADLPPSTSGSQGEQAAGDSPFTPELLKSAYNAFKKRWKLTRLDQESRIGRGPMSAGQRSTIVGIVAPDQFPHAVWEELVKRGRIQNAGSGMYRMP